MEIENMIKKYEQDMIKDICSLVKIKSVEQPPEKGMPFGEGPAKALEKALEIADNLGFKTKNMDNYCGYAEIGEGEDLIGILTHVDVVPEGIGWKHSAFNPVVEDGKIYARGVIDDKGPVVMILYALKILKELNTNFNKRVRLIIGANEETGFKCMDYYKKNEEDLTYGFSPDADFPVIFGEKGICSMEITGNVQSEDSIKLISMEGGQAANVVIPIIRATLEITNSLDIKSLYNTFLEKNNLKGTCKIDKNLAYLELDGVSAHASTPYEGTNACNYMFKFLISIIKNNDLVNNFNNLIGTDYYGEKLGISSYDEYGKLTFNIGIANIKNNKFSFICDIRYPITKTFEETNKKIQNIMNGKGYTTRILEHKKPLFVNPNSTLVKTLMTSYTNVTKDLSSKPFTIGGGTYSRAFDNVVGFGCAFPNEEYTAHQNDEYLKIDKMILSTKIYVEAIKNLLKM